MAERVPFSIRLRQAMDERGMRQVDLLEAVKPYCKKYNIQISKGQLSQYLAGRNEPGQSRIFILAQALDVSESWLIGLDVPKERSPQAATSDERAKEFITLFEKLTATQQLTIIQAMKGILADK
ncbi:hypothetical protein SDC9_125878 [bioreactor metagenome]|uniref:HTH cro/C1-type domain-containing protein n=1 Tax=bioreactor metagenome TaxID=1076179 RepID=A0A645CPK5_9ZZZZ